MKLAGEWLVRDYTRRTGMTHTIIRPSAVYGPFDIEDRVVSKFLLTAMRGGELQVNGQHEMLDFTYIDDAVDGIATASVSLDTDNSTYNIACGQARSLLEVAKLVVKLTGRGTIQLSAPDNNFPSRGQLDIARAHEDFGYLPQTRLEQGLEQYLDWLTRVNCWNI
jgi:nucleoside-diphosphate-sugar epimerase